MYCKVITTGGVKMKSESLKKGLLKAVEKVARTEVERNRKQWPPLCAAIYHQPKRPQA